MITRTFAISEYILFTYIIHLFLLHFALTMAATDWKIYSVQAQPCHSAEQNRFPSKHWSCILVDCWKQLLEADITGIFLPTLGPVEAMNQGNEINHWCFRLFSNGFLLSHLWSCGSQEKVALFRLTELQILPCKMFLFCLRFHFTIEEYGTGFIEIF